MISNWLNTLRELGNLIREIYFAPGEFVLSRFAELAPVTAANWPRRSALTRAIISGASGTTP